MNKVLYPFILSFIASISTVLGYFIIYLKCNTKKIITFSLSFATSVMLTVSITDLIPSSFSYLEEFVLLYRILIMIFFLILGIFLSFYISLKVDTNNSLERVGIISMLAIILHNIPEGIITFMVSKINLNLGLKLSVAIGLHNIPEGISIAIPIYYATKKKFKTFLIVLISGLSELLGSFIAYLFLSKFINNFIMGCIFSLTAGIMLNISLTEILKEAIKYKERKCLIIGLLLGVLIMLISHLIL